MHLRGVCIVDSAQHLTLHVNLLCSSRARREYLGGFGQASADDIILICCKRPLWPTVLGIKEGPTALSIKENVSGAARVLVATGHWVCRYQMYATTQSWKVSMVNESAAEKGGYRECILQVQSSPCCLPFCAVPSSFGPQLQRILALHALSRHSADLAGAADIRRLEWLRQHDHVSCMLSTTLVMNLASDSSTAASCTRQVAGQSVYSKLKFESGVHRVQRVPATESSGRVHTSTATVAVMPEVDDVDVQIDPKASGTRLSWLTPVWSLGSVFNRRLCPLA